jgi:hypothetical protein
MLRQGNAATPLKYAVLHNSAIILYKQLGNSPEQTPSEVTLIPATSNPQPYPAQQRAYTEPTLPKFNSSTVTLIVAPIQPPK